MTTPSTSPENSSGKRRRRHHRRQKPTGDRFKKFFKKKSVQLMMYGMILLAGIYIVYKLAPRFLDGGD